MDNLDLLLFTCRKYGSMEDTISPAQHSALGHLDNKVNNVRMLFIDYGSPFNTIISNKLIPKFLDLGLGAFFCNWLLDFLTIGL